MEDRKKHILESSIGLFMKLGVKALTMDDIAKHLRMSKKTLYQFVTDKSDLVKKCMQFSCGKDQCEVEKIKQQKGNAIDQIFNVSQFVISRLADVHPSIFFDLEKYHPEAMAIFDSHREDFIAETISQNIRNGIEQGLYREEINIEIITKIYLNSINQALHGTLFSSNDYTVSETYRELFMYHVRGIASAKGIKYLTEKAKKENIKG